MTPEISLLIQSGLVGLFAAFVLMLRKEERQERKENSENNAKERKERDEVYAKERLDRDASWQKFISEQRQADRDILLKIGTGLDKVITNQEDHHTFTELALAQMGKKVKPKSS